MRLKNKRAAIGSTLTWIPAMIIIVSILVLYFLILLKTYGWKDNPYSINFQGYEDSQLVMTKQVIYFLETNSENQKEIDRIKVLINSGKFEDIKKDFDNFAKKNNFACYIFEISAENGDISSGADGLTGFGGRANNLGFQDTFLEKGIKLNFPYETNKFANIKFYGGSCNL